MKSKDLNEIFNKTRRTENISLTVEQVKELISDLEVLEILKEWLVYDEREEAVMTYTDIPLDLKEKIMRWLDEKSN